MDTSDVAGGVDRKYSEEADDVTASLPHSCIPEKVIEENRLFSDLVLTFREE
jgi:hypothetical protein